MVKFINLNTLKLLAKNMEGSKCPSLNHITREGDILLVSVDEFSPCTAEDFRKSVEKLSELAGEDNPEMEIYMRKK